MNARSVASAKHVSDDRLERAAAFVAYLVLRYGDEIAPVLDRLEQEIEERRHRRSPRARAEAALARYSVPAETVKAIR